MSKRKVTLLAPTKGAKRGDEIEVDGETAEYLIANGSARAVKPGKAAESKSDKG